MPASSVPVAAATVREFSDAKWSQAVYRLQSRLAEALVRTLFLRFADETEIEAQQE